MGPASDDPPARARDWQRLQELFHAVVDLPTAERAALLDLECAGDAELRREIESLIDSYDADPGFLEARAGPRPAEAAAASGEAPERGLVGPYRLVRCIGAGGMGAVYLAERADEHFQQRVALKLVHGGLGSEEILRRFRAERQILASLEHPNIARLLDGGCAEDGRPYLVMEYVEAGEPLDEHCRRRSLPLPERLRLFRTVCAAVGHAHRNLIVHRDLKPSNILVSRDGVVKLLDFGIAKLLDAERLGLKAPPTRTGAGLMTPEYASPEQLRGDPITTASDVYALGVVLFQLLCGRLPYRLPGGSIEEVVAAICQEAPARPSVAAERAGPEAARLARELRGDLDNIVLLALRKDPRERYPSVEALSEDVLRHLEHRPVGARGETAGYVLRKFVRRHRAPVAAAAVATLSLLTGLAGTAWQAGRARVERDRARLETRKAEQVSRLLIEVFDTSDPTREARADQRTVREVLERGGGKVLDRLSGEPELQGALLHVLGRVHGKLGQYQRASELLEEAVRRRRAPGGRADLDLAESLHELSAVLLLMDRPAVAEPAAREALAIRQARLGAEHPLLAESLVQLARVRDIRNDLRGGEVEGYYQRALAIEGRAHGAESIEAARVLDAMADFFLRQSRHREAEAAYRRALAIIGARLGADHLEAARVMESLSVTLGDRGEYGEAEGVRRRALAIRLRWLGEGHPELAESYSNLGTLLYKRGDLDGALVPLRRALALWRQGGAGAVSLALSNLGVVLTERGEHAEAEALLRESLALRIAAHGEDNGAVAHVRMNLAVALAGQGRLVEGERLLREALEAWRRTDGDHLVLARTHAALGKVLLGLGRLEEAEESLGEALRRYQRIFPGGHPDLGRPLTTLAEVYLQRGWAERAKEAAQSAVTAQGAKLPADHFQLAEARSVLGACLLAQRRTAEARALLAESRAVLAAKLGRRDARTERAERWLAELEGRGGEGARAARR